MLSAAQIKEYHEVGAIVVPDVLTPAEVAHLSTVTDGFVERARGLTGHLIFMTWKIATPPSIPASAGSRRRRHRTRLTAH